MLGTFEAMILVSLADLGKAHGYRVVKYLEREGPTVGAVYTALYRLREKELVEDEEWKEGTRNRRVFWLTEKGEAAKTDWQERIRRWV